ncbi:hypothetical protein PMAYCL1PPCAC_02463, partial [Pristionchus mayeri]
LVMTSSKPSSSNSSFIVVITGQVESGYFPSIPSLYIRSSYHSSSSFGWQKLAGEDALSTCCSIPNNGRFVVDLPLSATFKGSSPFRWPQLVFSCYGMDPFGHDVCRGYGACSIPTLPGSHTREVACFTPEASSTIQSMVGWVTGRRPEFVDPTIVAQEDGREVTRVRSQGILHVKINVMIRGTKQMGFDLFPASMQRISEFPLPDFQVQNRLDNDPQQPTQPVLNIEKARTLSNLVQKIFQSEIPEGPETSTKEERSKDNTKGSIGWPYLKFSRGLFSRRSQTSAARSRIQEVTHSCERV